MAGPTLEPVTSLRRWIETQPDALFRLPVTFLRGDPRAAVLGEGWSLSLDDSALGVSLADRVRQVCVESSEGCVVWLTVRPGPLVDGGAPTRGEGISTFAVLAVHDRVPPGTPTGDLRAEVARGADCLAIRFLRQGHCAKGAVWCARCREAEAASRTPALVDLCPEGDLARPTLQVERAGREAWRPYDVLRRFADVEEARAFGRAHGIADVVLETEAR